MNAFAALRSADPATARREGTEHTVSEILQQPQSWLRLIEVLRAVGPGLEAFLAASPGPVVLTGAGSSAYVGDALAPTLAAWTGRSVLSLPTTDLVTHGAHRVPQGPGLCVSFARSGNSPESLAAVERLRTLRPGFRHLAITCNPEGALSRAMRGPESFSLVMPPETHDASLVMTSSFTTMYLAGLLVGTGGRIEDWAVEVTALAARTERFIDRFAPLVTGMKAQQRSRIQYLGSGPHAGGIREMRLKLVEMSDGALVAQDETYLGLRHGPQVYVRPDSLVVAVLSADPAVRPYEYDLLNELRAKGQGKSPLVLAAGEVEPDRLPGDAVLMRLSDGGPPTTLSQRAPDAFGVPAAVVAGQMLATVSCLNLGLKPDAPSAGGTISRVVQGVTIYPQGASS